MKRTVLSMLEHAANEFSGVPYVSKKQSDGWEDHSFRDVQRDARAFAAALLSRGFKPQDTIAILAEGSPDWVSGEFGTVYAGCISVPLSIKLQPEEIPYRINHSEAEAMIVSKNMLGKVAEVYQNFDSTQLPLFIIDEDGSTEEELLEKFGAPYNLHIELYRNVLLEGYRVFEDVKDKLLEIEDGTQEDDVVTISYTSGTTGNPKGIMLTHLNYYANCKDSVEMFDVPYAKYRTLLVLPCDHSFAHTVGIYAALLRGISLYFVDARGGGMAILRNIPKNLTETNPTFLLTVPALSGNFMKKIRHGISEKGEIVRKLFETGLQSGIKYHGDGFHTPPISTRIVNFLPYKLADRLIFQQVRKTFGADIRFFVGGGALLDVKQQEFFNALGVPIYQGYGLTEAAPVISSNLPRIHKFGSSGTVAPSIECKIIRDDGSEARIGERGEVVIRGENVMKGYFKNVEATAETIREGWLHTGDLGFFDEDGFLFVVGRAKALLIASDGEKYSPEGIEEAIINSSDLIEQCMLHNDHNHYTSALLVLNSDRLKKLMQEKKSAGIPDLLDTIKNEMLAFREDEKYRNLFPSQWLPVTFQLIPEAFSEENKMINSSMKMVRYKISEVYHERIQYMYTDEGKAYDNPKNRQVLKDLI